MHVFLTILSESYTIHSTRFTCISAKNLQCNTFSVS